MTHDTKNLLLTKSDLITLRARSGQNTDVSYVLVRWKQNGLIEEVATNTYRKK